LEKQLAAKLAAWEEGLTEEQRAKLTDAIAKIVKTAPDKRAAKQRQALAEHIGKGDAVTAKLNKTLADYVKKAPTSAFVPTLAVGTGRKTHVLIRGDFLRPGADVEAGVPSVLPPLTTASKPSRLDLARWLVA